MTDLYNFDREKKELELDTITGLLEGRNLKKMDKLSLSDFAKEIRDITDGADILGSTVVELYDLIRAGLLR